MNPRNEVVASGKLADRQPLRYTPAGLPAVEFSLLHDSTQTEAGKARQVQCEFACIGLGDVAHGLAALDEGTEITVKGFMAARSLRWRNRLVLHCTAFKRVSPNQS